MINLGTANLGKSLGSESDEYRASWPIADLADHWRDDWTAVTLDGRRSAQFEETIL
jgi:hypothetical protein